MSTLLRAVFGLPIKLCRFMGPALILLCALIAALVIVPIKAERKAVSEALDRDATEVMTFEEVDHDEEHMDRVFRVKLKNSGSTAKPFPMLYITDEDRNIIFNSVRAEFDSLRINDRPVTNGYIPPGSECVVYALIDDYKLDGLDHIYVTDVYSKEDRGRRFDIEVKNYRSK